MPDFCIRRVRLSRGAVNPAVDAEATIAPGFRWNLDRQDLVLQPTRKDDELVGFGNDIDDRARSFAEGIGKTVKPEFAAAKTTRLLAEIIHTRQHTDPLQAFARVDMSLEMAAIAMASELEFSRLDRRLDKTEARQGKRRNFPHDSLDGRPERSDIDEEKGIAAGRIEPALAALSAADQAAPECIFAPGDMIQKRGNHRRAKNILNDPVRATLLRRPLKAICDGQ